MEDLLDTILGGDWNEVYKNDIENEKNYDISTSEIRQDLSNSSFGYVENNNYIDSNFNLNDFLFIRLVGRGAYGEVWLAQNIKTNEFVAIKKYYLMSERDGASRTTIREITLLRDLTDNENIIKLKNLVFGRFNSILRFPCSDDCLEYQLNNLIKDFGLQKVCTNNYQKLHISSSDCFNDDQQKNSAPNLYSIFEYTPYDLNTYIKHRNENNDPMSLEEVRYIAYSVLKALEYCHSNNVLHRDLKTANLLIDLNGTVKIGDFGLARYINTKSNIACVDDLLALPVDPGVDTELKLTNLVMTLWYRSPELLLGATQYTSACDIWSFGCLLYEVITRKPLFNGKNEDEMIKMILRKINLANLNEWPEIVNLKLYPIYAPYIIANNNYVFATKIKFILPLPVADFLLKCLQFNPHKRAKIYELFEHEFLKDKILHPLSLDPEILVKGDRIDMKKERDRIASHFKHFPDQISRFITYGEASDKIQQKDIIDRSNNVQLLKKEIIKYKQKIKELNTNPITETNQNLIEEGEILN